MAEKLNSYSKQEIEAATNAPYYVVCSNTPRKKEEFERFFPDIMRVLKVVSSPSEIPQTPDVQERIFSQLLQAGVTPSLASQIVNHQERRCSKRGNEPLEEHLVSTAQEKITVGAIHWLLTSPRIGSTTQFVGADTINAFPSTHGWVPVEKPGTTDRKALYHAAQALTRQDAVVIATALAITQLDLSLLSLRNEPRGASAIQIFVEDFCSPSSGKEMPGVRVRTRSSVSMVAVRFDKDSCIDFPLDAFENVPGGVHKGHPAVQKHMQVLCHVHQGKVTPITAPTLSELETKITQDQQIPRSCVYWIPRLHESLRFQENPEITYRGMIPAEELARLAQQVSMSF